MANYWSEFSIAFKLPSEEAIQYALDLHKKLNHMVRVVGDLSGADEWFIKGGDYTNDFECERHELDSHLWI